VGLFIWYILQLLGCTSKDKKSHKSNITLK
jgi:hypothetical protein